MAAAEATPLGGQPAAESGAVRNLQPVQEISREQIDQRAPAGRRQRLDALGDRTLDLDGVDQAAVEVEVDSVVPG